MRCVAVDLGAESCRVSLAEGDGPSARLELVHRFANGPLEDGGHLYWELDRIVAGVEEGLRLCASRSQGAIDAVGVDGWAVDYVRLDQAGRPLARPFCYRDPRTEEAMPQVWERMPRERLYQLTGIQFLRFNTLYQLCADRRDGLAPGACWLNIPEYVLHHLGAPQVSEYTGATHTQLVDARTRTWCDEIFERAGLDRCCAAPIVPPGTALGPLRGELASLPAFRNTQLIAPACHDTGAAVAAIPDSRDDWAFLSSGTWSLVGAVIENPCTTAEALAENFTNEGGVGGRIRFLKNVNGMWLLEECLREWRAAGGLWSAADLVEECSRRPVPRARFNVDSPALLLPGRMPSRINEELRKAGHPPVGESPESAPALAGIIFASLAERYAQVLDGLRRVTGRRFARLYIMGGGSQNRHLNRLVAERTGLEIALGPVESSTVGNAAIQFAVLESGGQRGVTPESVATWASRLVPRT